MEFEWKISRIFAIILIGIGIMATFLVLFLLNSILTSQIIDISGMIVITLVFCVLYSVIGVLILIASLKDSKNLSLAGLMIGLIIFSFALIMSFLIITGLIDIKSYAVPWLVIAHEGLDDLPEIFQLMIYLYFGLPIHQIIPSVGFFYWINIYSSIAGMTLAILAYLYFEK